MTIQRLQRWALILMGYTYTIRYRPTKQHGNADCLSRLPTGPDDTFDSGSPRVVIPKQLQPKVLSILHQEHWGLTRMKQISRRYCWWPSIDDDITKTVSRCVACQNNASTFSREYTSWPTTEEVWELIHIDFAGPFQKQMWLIVVDSKSKFPFVVRMASTTSEATIQALRSIFALEGLPKTLVSDNGTQFTSNEFQLFCRNNSIKHVTSAPFNPESNGAAERMVRTFKTALRKILLDTPRWDEALLVFLSTYRSTPDDSGISPAEKLHGRQHRTILSTMVPEASKANTKFKTKFSIGQPVFVRQYQRKEKWIAAVVDKTLGRRMYCVRASTDVGQAASNDDKPDSNDVGDMMHSSSLQANANLEQSQTSSNPSRRIHPRNTLENQQASGTPPQLRRSERPRKQVAFYPN
ncbi:uncharacterized protein K02A2.6-like [Eupeodes corollae]|uniref:uncharacterized protein K02A2.6-like n=1 Tax=Eupeodes corollae TaxID=290404 RepID=UPI0024923C9B|nr:uncharacterized protein K02A2.6-like [Eupeodes corollae]